METKTKAKGRMQRMMSFFRAPITNKVPAQEVTVQSLHQFITSNAQLRENTEWVRAQLGNANYFRAEKQRCLPYVTPAGVFSYCAAKDLVYLNGLQVFDIDHLASPQEAAEWRDRLFADDEMAPELAFVSPSGCGVKLFVPYRLEPSLPLEKNFRLALETTWGYLKFKYDLQADRSGSDIARSCFVAFDEEAKIRG
jgi:hypothetical protein